MLLGSIRWFCVSSWITMYFFHCIVFFSCIYCDSCLKTFKFYDHVFYSYLPSWKTVKKGDFLSEDRAPVTKLMGAENLCSNGFWTFLDTFLIYKLLFPQGHLLPKHQIKQIKSCVLFVGSAQLPIYIVWYSIHNNKYFQVFATFSHSATLYRLLWGYNHLKLDILCKLKKILELFFFQKGSFAGVADECGSCLLKTGGSRPNWETWQVWFYYYWALHLCNLCLGCESVSCQLPLLYAW